MALDSNAQVTISLSGLFLLCVNKNRQNRVEAGMIACDHHSFTFDIERIEIGPGGLPLSSTLVEYDLNLDEDIRIRVVDSNGSSVPGAVYYANGDFDRLSATDEHDFRWVPNLEGPEFHNKTMTLIDSPHPTIFIDGALLYTEMKSQEKLGAVPKFRAGADTSGRTLKPMRGPVAFKVGADLVVPKGGRVELWNRDEKALEWPDTANVKYHITIDNLCQPMPSDSNGPEPATDFLLLYNVIQDGDLRFDLQRIVENNGDSESRLDDDPSFSWDNPPFLPCIGASASETKTLV